MIDPKQSVNAVLAEHPATGTVFNDCGIDMCCGGELSLEEAARGQGVELPVLLEALTKAAGVATAAR